MKKSKFASVIICTLNRYEDLVKTIHGVLNQNYPKDCFELIIVDDGSTDSTKTIGEEYPGIVHVRHTTNKGIPRARNAGLEQAKGEIIVYIDDDCIADREWLTSLTALYDDEDVIAAGGQIIAQEKSSIVSDYMAQTGYGNPNYFKFEKSMNIFQLLLTYIRIWLFPIFEMKGDTFPITELCGANCSFRREYILAVKGFTPELTTSEDTEICKKMISAFPDKKIVYTKKAIVAHKHYTTFKRFYGNEFTRAKNTFSVQSEEIKYPPIAPIFSLSMLALLCCLIINPILILPALFIVPQLFYFWWPLKSVLKRKIHFLLFPYMQFGLEFSRTTGILYGFFKPKKEFSHEC